MVKNKPGWSFPSGLINEIEQPLRRKFRSEREIPTWLLLLIGVLIATISYFIVATVVDDQAHAAEVSREVTKTTICSQYKADMELIGGTAAEDTLNQICN